MKLFDFKTIGIPLHIGENHWALAVVKIKSQEIFYYDSLGKNGLDYLQVLNFKTLELELERNFTTFTLESSASKLTVC
jgi:Ulp1 family protease